MTLYLDKKYSTLDWEIFRRVSLLHWVTVKFIAVISGVLDYSSKLSSREAVLIYFLIYFYDISMFCSVRKNVDCRLIFEIQRNENEGSKLGNEEFHTVKIIPLD